jgi:ABC-type dipeptide/oligopeptide/nickel transport system permease subunit
VIVGVIVGVTDGVTVGVTVGVTDGFYVVPVLIVVVGVLGTLNKSPGLKGNTLVAATLKHTGTQATRGTRKET